MKVLVAVATRHCSTREIAETIARELRSSGLEVDLRDADAGLDIAGYQAIILGSAVHSGSWIPAATKFVYTHALDLLTIPVWLFSTGPLEVDRPESVGDPTHVPGLLAATGARGHKVFAGRFDRRTLHLDEQLAELVHAPDGDLRDWDAVRDWARLIASSLVVAESLSV